MEQLTPIEKILQKLRDEESYCYVQINRAKERHQEGVMIMWQGKSKGLRLAIKMIEEEMEEGNLK